MHMHTCISTWCHRSAFSVRAVRIFYTTCTYENLITCTYENHKNINKAIHMKIIKTLIRQVPTTLSDHSVSTFLRAWVCSASACVLHTCNVCKRSGTNTRVQVPCLSTTAGSARLPSGAPSMRYWSTFLCPAGDWDGHPCVTAPCGSTASRAGLPLERKLAGGTHMRRLGEAAREGTDTSHSCPVNRG